MKKILCSLLVIFILISEFSFCFGTTENAVVSNEVKSSENAVDVNDDTENIKPENKIQNETNAKEENTKENENKKETNVTNEAVKTEEKKVEVNNKVKSAPVVQEVPKSTQTNQSIKTKAISTAGMRDGLYVIDGVWRMVVNGKIVYDYTGLGKNSNGTWYMEKGAITYKYNGKHTDSTGTYLIRNSRVIDDTGLLVVDNQWRMVVKGKVEYNYTGLAENANGTWYLENGVLTYKYRGTALKNGKAYIIEGSYVRLIVSENTTGIYVVNGNWRMIVNGKVVYDYTGVGKNANGMWYFEKGNLTYKYTGTYYDNDTAYIIEKSYVVGVFKKDATELAVINNQWRMVVKGKVVYDYTGLGKNANGTWYMEKGAITYKYNGKHTDSTGTYLIRNSRVIDDTGLLVVDNQWRMVVKGKVEYNYTGLAENANGTWYLENGVLTYKYRGTALKNGKAYIIEGSYVRLIVSENTTGIYVVNGNWRMIVNGKVVYDYTGVGKNANGMWYFEKGNLTYKYTGTYYDNNTAYIIENSYVVGVFKKDTTGLAVINNHWRMVVNGKVVYDYTGLGKNSSGTWYMEKGVITYKYNGKYTDSTGSYLIKNSRVIDDTGLMVVENKWRMVTKGKVDYNYTGLAENANGTWFLEKGELTYKYNGTTFKNGKAYIIEGSYVRLIVAENATGVYFVNNKWRMIVKGRVNYEYTGLGKNANGTWYFENGELTFKYNGIYKDETGTYIIKNSEVKNTTGVCFVENKWRMVINGKVDYNYTGIGQKANEMWYFEKGELTFNYRGTYFKDNTAYIIEESRVYLTVTKNTSGLMVVNNKWRRVVNGVVDYTYTGLVENTNGMWFLENGELTYKYSGTTFKDNKAYIIEGSYVHLVVPESATGMYVVNNCYRMIIKGRVDYNYTGPAENENGRWYFENGIITYTYNAEYEDTDGIIYNIVNSRFSGIISRPGYFGKMEVEQPLQSNKYVSDSLIISGWILTSEVNDKVLVYVDGKYVGEATRGSRQDILDKYKDKYGTSYKTTLPGFTYDLTKYGLGIGNHIIKIENVSADGKVLIQSRIVTFNIEYLAKSYGIDVSHYQGEIDWNAVKKSGVTFAILKIGEYWSNSKRVVFDQFFEKNYQACKRLGIAVGGYFYSYAFNGDEANAEADVCLSLIKNKKFELPIFLDVEDKIIKNAVANGKASVDTITNAAVTFCQRMASAGHQGGVYASRDFFYNYFNIPLIEKFAIWLAHYTTNQTNYTGKYDFWQYTSTGSVPGINGNVDLNWFYKR